MFALHETTRKYVCRIAFFALCVVPSLFTAWWISAHHWPGRKGRIARGLSESLDVHVKLADWREPRPRLVRTRGVTLSDPESARVLSEIKTFEMRRGSQRSYAIDEIAIDATQLDRAAEKLYAWISKLPPEIHEVRCGKLIIKLDGRHLAVGHEAASSGFVLHQIRGRIDRDETGRTRMQVVAQTAQSPTADAVPLQLTLAPSTGKESTAPTLTLETAGSSMPVQLISSIPGFNSLGAEAQFAGVIRWTLAVEAGGAAQGRLTAVDLSELLPVSSPHALHGLATVEIQEFRWQGGRIERIVGTVDAAHAQMSQSLVEATTSKVGFQCPQASSGVTVAGDASMIALDLLALRFQLGGEGLTFWGNCPASTGLQEDCIAVSGGQPLLLAPRYYNWPLGVLVQTMCGRPTAWVPATREAVDWSSRLPLPLK